MGPDRQWIIDPAQHIPLAEVARHYGKDPRSVMNQLRRMGVPVEQAGPYYPWVIHRASYEAVLGPVEVR